jgi:Glu-tRNA(Gln) amidotransferase subunit E-like FAD-binding protein
MVELTSGLEIHQQLDTHKLFCNCPSLLRSDNPEFEIRRRLHAVAGEGGKVDIAAKHEADKDKEFVYQGYDTTCLVELDEAPPHLINQEALQIAIHVSLLMNCEIVPITQIMRKTVVDGSNTSGFQRTVLIGKNGSIETPNGKVGINYVYLEEDAARPASGGDAETSENVKTYKLDRLGIPMLEVVTAPDIKTPEQAKEVALEIGDILRSCKVKRGIGTIRQDINVSIPGHPRAEIKGFQDPDIFIEVIEKEMKRQEEDLNNKNELRDEVRGANVDGTTKFLRPMPGSARMYPETDLPLLRISKKIIDEAKETLPKLRSDIKAELKEIGLRDDEIQILLKQNKLGEFESLLKIIDDPRFIFKVLIEIPTEVGKHENKGADELDETLTLDIIESVVYAIKEEKIEKSDIKHVMEEILNGKSFDESIRIEKADLGEIESEIAKLVKSKPGLTLGGYMGLIMQKFKGKVSGKEVSEILSKIL